MEGYSIMHEAYAKMPATFCAATYGL